LFSDVYILVESMAVLFFKRHGSIIVFLRVIDKNVVNFDSQLKSQFKVNTKTQSSVSRAVWVTSKPNAKVMWETEHNCCTVSWKKFMSLFSLGVHWPTKKACSLMVDRGWVARHVLHT